MKEFKGYFEVAKYVMNVMNILLIKAVPVTEKLTNVAVIFHLDSTGGVRDPWATLSKLKGTTVIRRISRFRDKHRLGKDEQVFCRVHS